jgi:hypothetical protein
LQSELHRQQLSVLLPVVLVRVPLLSVIATIAVVTSASTSPLTFATPVRFGCCLRCAANYSCAVEGATATDEEVDTMFLAEMDLRADVILSLVCSRSALALVNRLSIKER